MFHVVKEDPENLFSFIFKTVPENSSGLPHILEHSVLAGSEGFPLKDPFLHLLKGSMNTFLNAMTYPDKTLYPAASTVKKDFFNLFRVYGDAVFFPLLKREVFDQEGYRIAPDGEGNLTLNGVVFNEMKGNYGNHDSIAGDWSCRSLFTDSPYRFDSGGDPVSIPDLKYEDFLLFHKKFYHPSNCSIFLYGDIPTDESLAFLDTYFLKHFKRLPLPSDISDQTRWGNPRFFEKTSPAGMDEPLEGRSTLVMNWLLSGVTGRLDALRFEVLTEILLGNAGAPLRKALVESGIGEDLSPVSGLETDLKEMVFSVGLRGTDPDKRTGFEHLVLDALKSMAIKGFPEESLAGALQRVEFRNREIPAGVPFGLKLLGRSIKGWLYGTEPYTTLEMADSLDTLKGEIEQDSRVFRKLIERQLLSNNHRTTVLIRPDRDHNENLENHLNSRLQEKKRSLSEDSMADLVQAHKRLQQFQAAPDDEQAIASLPSLNITELPKEVGIIETVKEELESVPLYIHDMYTNGIAYIDFAFNIADVTGEDRLLLPFLTRAIPGSGLENRPYDQVARELAMKTGGFYGSVEAGSCLGNRGSGRAFLMFRLKALEPLLPEALKLAERLMLEPDFSDERRISELVRELRNDFKARIIPRGNAFASLRAARYLSPFSRMEEEWRGISQLNYLHKVTETLPESLPDIVHKVQHLRDRVIRTARISIQITAGPGGRDSAIKHLKGFIRRCPAGEMIPEMISPEHLSKPYSPGVTEFIPIPVPVGYAAGSLPGYALGEDGQAYQSVLAHFLTTGFLWETVRMKGGAYGASAGSDAMEGIFIFNSYRDPAFPKTPEVFREALEKLVQEPLTRESLEKAIIGTIGKDTKPHVPAVKGIIGFKRALYGITDEARQRKRDLILSMSVQDLKGAAAALLERTGEGATVIMGPEGSVTSANLDLSNTERVPVPL